MSKKLLVLENVDHLDPQCSHFMEQQFDEGWERKILYHVSDVNPNELYHELLQCNAILVQSTFDDRKQAHQILELLTHAAYSHDHVFDLYIVYHYLDFLPFVNLELDPIDRALLKDLMNKCRVFEVVHDKKLKYRPKTSSLFEPPPMIDPYIFFTDAVQLYWHEELKVFWHRRRPVLKFQPDDMYPDEVQSNVVKRIMRLTPSELKSFRALLREALAGHTYNLEDLEHGGKNLGFSRQERNALIKEKNEWIALITKILSSETYEPTTSNR